MDNEKFLEKIREKIEGTAGRPIELTVDTEQATRISVDLNGALPKVVFGAGIFRYPGLARLGVEYAVACLRRGRALDELEFHVILRRN